MGTKPRQFNSFLVDISRDLNEQDLEDLAFTYEDEQYGISKGDLEKVKTGLHLFKILKKMGIISEGNMDDLIDKLRVIRRDDLAEKCEGFNNMTNAGEYIYTFRCQITLVTPLAIFFHRNNRPRDELLIQ